MRTEASVTLDLHGKNTFQAKTAIDAALRRAGGAYRLCIIHGYQRGDAIKAMIRDDYSSHPDIIAVEEGANPGQTDLLLRKL